jgi:hypothetical protein
METSLKHLPEIATAASSVIIFLYMFIIGRTAAVGILLALLPVLIYLVWNYVVYNRNSGGRAT